MGSDMTDTYSLSIQDIAMRLDMRKQHRNGTVLVLGSRAGSLFRSQSFYTTLSRFSSRSFSELSRNEAFEECYRVLQRKEDLGTSDVNGIINRVVQEVTFSGEDEALARLIQQGYFSDIITTNVDDVLEEALRYVGLRAGRDFETKYPTIHADMNQLHLLSCTRIVKVFGDFLSGNYAIRERMQYLTTKARSYLEVFLRKDLLMVGVDPVWDEELLLVCPLLGDTLWYMNEETSLPPLAERLMRGRQGAIFCGADGQYSQFFPKLSQQMHPNEAVPVTTAHKNTTNQQAGDAKSAADGHTTVQSPATPSSGPAVSQPANHKRTKIFIPYSRVDNKYLDRLHVFLKQFSVFDEALSVWDDTKILPGTDWHKEIERALAETRIAVPLVSADFFSSNFIMEEELPPLLEAAQNGEVIVLPVITSSCFFKESPLGRFQAINDPKNPLSSLNKSKQDQLWMQLAKRIKEILDKDKRQ
jgi:hypothetical protein